ncbi:MAG: YfiR/HmsC family protein [Elusimicrobia bacterium]|nr:YfiR/HmsC family protein [Candidatus Liberimonas magnetica]
MRTKFLSNLFLFCLIHINVLNATFLPYKIQATLILKILNYDQNITRNAVDNVITIGIVYENNRKWVESSKNLLIELLALKDKKLINNGVNFCLLSYESFNQPEIIKAKKISVLYLNIETSENIVKVTEFAKKSGMLTIFGQDSYEKMKNGISIGLMLENEKPLIILNNESAVKEGSDFSKDFLTLVKSYK